MGVHGFPIDAMRLAGVPGYHRHFDLCHPCRWQQRLAFNPVRQRFRHLFATGIHSSRLFLLQEVLWAKLAVHECLQDVLHILDEELPPSDQPLASGQM